MANVLIIDNRMDYIARLAEMVRALGHTVSETNTIRTGMKTLRSENFDVVFLGDRLPDGLGIDFISQVVDDPNRPEVVMVADDLDAAEAEKAILEGAWDYLKKPAAIEPMKLTLVRALEYRAKKSISDSQSTQPPIVFDGIIGRSPVLKSCLELAGQAAQSDVSVLINGETGTGKALIARAIHENSKRKDADFVVVDCASIPPTLVESTLFGHERGAFTGAERSHDGLIKQANGGTLFLDEIGEMNLDIQTSFLRVLEGKRYRSVGSRGEKTSDFRIMAATNRNLDEMVQQKLFRRELLFRLRAFTIEMPPLRKRREDIEELVHHFLRKFYVRYKMPGKNISDDFLSTLVEYDWPGNVRELIHALERALAAARQESLLLVRHLPLHIQAPMNRSAIKSGSVTGLPAEAPKAAEPPIRKLQDVRDEAMAELERRYLKELTSRTDGNIKEACRLSGLSRSRLYALLKKYGLSGVR